jgi:hypothetical protein
MNFRPILLRCFHLNLTVSWKMLELEPLSAALPLVVALLRLRIVAKSNKDKWEVEFSNCCVTFVVI